MNQTQTISNIYNLYVDMNGLIHPCSHPEDREPPSTEEEMYLNVTKYLDRLVAAVRPRRLLYLAIDGVAPRAKMNQQRSRRFRAAQDAKEKQEIMDSVLAEMEQLGYGAPAAHKTTAWDSNVITPGTEFMTKLSLYIRFYILERMNSNSYWRSIKVIFSDASEPGEGEHKIMGYIRNQRAQSGFDPNQHHILHGLDADLIMLALATHEAHFTILREKVTFGKKKNLPEISPAQQMLDAQSMRNGTVITCVDPEDTWVYKTPLQALHISILREYLDGEFQCLKYTVPFGYNLERIIDDFIFLCFFVGNDFLPHLPSLDIRDGALDFLIELYKDLLPSLGNYITNPGGYINLVLADIILAKVGEIEDQIFVQRKRAEEKEERFRQQREQNNARQMATKENSQKAVVTTTPILTLAKPPPPPSPPPTEDTQTSYDDEVNKSAADKLRKTLLGKRKSSASVDDEGGAKIRDIDQDCGENKVDGTMDVEFVAKAQAESCKSNDANEDESDEVDEDLEAEVDAIASSVGDVVPKQVKEVSKEEMIAAKEELKRRIKEREQAVIDNYKQTIQDGVRLHEQGWKERYYGEQYKKENIEAGGGLGRMCYCYVQGLCWVMLYYYQGVPSWNWYYPFHYAPFASDLRNIDSYGKIEFELSEPFRAIEQLLAVFPANSAHALPEPCRWLMTDPESPIIDLYDDDVPIDPNGKHLPWLWILLLPFIDESRITAAFESIRAKLSLEEARRNKVGKSVVFVHSDHSLGKRLASNIRYAPAVEEDEDVTRALDLKAKELDEQFGNCSEVTRKESDVTNDTRAQHNTEESFFDCLTGGGMCGYTSRPPATMYAGLHNAIPVPYRFEEFFASIPDNKILVFTYRLPQMEGVHSSDLLPGAQLSAPVLDQFDLMPKRPPRLNRGGFNIIELFRSSRGNDNTRYQGYGGPNTAAYNSFTAYPKSFNGGSNFNDSRAQGYNHQVQRHNVNAYPEYYSNAPSTYRSPSYHNGNNAPYAQSYQDPYNQQNTYGGYGGLPPSNTYQQSSETYPYTYSDQSYYGSTQQRVNGYGDTAFGSHPQSMAYPLYHQQQPVNQYGASTQEFVSTVPVVRPESFTSLEDKDTKRMARRASHHLDRSTRIGALSRSTAPGASITRSSSGSNRLAASAAMKSRGARQAIFLDELPGQQNTESNSSNSKGKVEKNSVPHCGPAPAGPTSSQIPEIRPTGGNPQGYSFLSASNSHMHQHQSVSAPPHIAGNHPASMQSIRDQLLRTVQGRGTAQLPPRGPYR